MVTNNSLEFPEGGSRVYELVLVSDGQVVKVKDPGKLVHVMMIELVVWSRIHDGSIAGNHELNSTRSTDLAIETSGRGEGETTQ